MSGANAPATALEADDGGCLPPIDQVLAQLRRSTLPPRLPSGLDGTAGLPDILAAAGHERIACDPPPGWPAAWCWWGPSGTGIGVNASPDGALPSHAGGLPVAPWSGRLPRSSWHRELERRWAGAVGAADDPWTVANPLPFSVAGVARIVGMAHEDPAAVIDPAGRRSLTQVDGADLLTGIELPGCGELTLRPHGMFEDPTAWQVGPEVLDNGRVRAEFDHLGRLTRLCVDGRFADLAGPAVDPCDDQGHPLEGLVAGAARVVCAGPVRARVERALRSPRGEEWRLGYQLDAGSDLLVITLERGDGGPVVARHPQLPIAGDGTLRYDHGEERLIQRPELATGARPWRRGWRTAAFAATRDQAPLAILLLEPAALLTGDEHAVLAAPGVLRYALSTADRDTPLRDLRRAMAARWAPRSGRRRLALPEIADDAGLLPLWVEAGDGDDEDLELLVAVDPRRRASLRVSGGERPLRRLDADAPDARQSDDGWELPLAAGSLVRIRCPSGGQGA